MGLFNRNKDKKDKQLEQIVNQIRVDLSNNYKDNAKENLNLLETIVTMKKGDGKLQDPQYYEELIAGFKQDIENFKRTY